MKMKMLRKIIPNTVLVYTKDGEMTNIRAGFDVTSLGISLKQDPEDIEKILLGKKWKKGETKTLKHLGVELRVYRKKTGIRFFSRR
ncbi:MAG: hypothetical protein J7L43_02350 [Candidatus Aenigmarchaeota archaeon]|nr:hypothetical protein [Candidatus Aenigmarchaeota archaeon]